MKKTTQVATRFREIFLEGKWVVNTNLKAQISDLNWKQATTKIGNLNSIAALTFHLGYYLAGVLQVLEGGSLDIRDKYSFDMPPIKSQKDWEHLINKILADAEKFATLLDEMTDEQLAAPFVDEKYGNYRRNMDILIEHSYYHLGQIVLIKKMVLG